MDYTEQLNNIINYYTNLLIVQYHNKPKARATIKLMAKLLWVNMILLQIRDAFDWRTAIGKQLDIIGEWVGVTRFYNGQLFYFRPWFSLIDWNKEPDNLQGGFSRFTSFEQTEGGFLDYDNILPTQNRLADSSFRIMIGLKIIKNSISATCKNIDEAIWEYFNGDVYTVWGNNTLTYYYKSTISEVIEVAKEKNVLPCPTGIKIELKEILDNDRELKKN